MAYHALSFALPFPISMCDLCPASCLTPCRGIVVALLFAQAYTRAHISDAHAEDVGNRRGMMLCDMPVS